MNQWPTAGSKVSIFLESRPTNHPFLETPLRLNVYVKLLNASVLVTLSFEDLTRFIHKSGKNKFKNQEKVAKVFQKILRESYRRNQLSPFPLPGF